MTFEDVLTAKADWPHMFKSDVRVIPLWHALAAYAAGRESMRQECLDACEGSTVLQYTNVFDGKPWETRNDPNWYCFNAIKGIK